MKKIFALLVSCFMPFVCAADYYDDGKGVLGSALQYKVTEAIRNLWGNPKLSSTYIQDTNRDYGAFRIKEGWACCGEQTKTSTKINDKDDVAIMAFVAHNITEHGAEFCLEQFAAKSESTDTFLLLHQQPRWPGLQCAWFCEPGWDGTACMEKNAPDDACNTTDYKQRIDEVKSKIYETNDAISLHYQRVGVAEYTAVLDSMYVKGGRYYPHEIVIGAVDFMEHGIVAKPIIVAAVGDHPAVTTVTSSGTATGKTKVLCAQGFTADDKCNVSSKNCGKALWCSGYSENIYKSRSDELEKVVNGYCNAYVCKGDKALDDDLKTCIDCKASPRTGRCDVAGSDLFGRCKTCSIGFFFNPATCDCDAASVALTKLDLQYGKYRTDVVTNQCWTKENEKSYKDCVMTAVE